MKLHLAFAPRAAQRSVRPASRYKAGVLGVLFALAGCTRMDPATDATNATDTTELGAVDAVDDAARFDAPAERQPDDVREISITDAATAESALDAERDDRTVPEDTADAARDDTIETEADADPRDVAREVAVTRDPRLRAARIATMWRTCDGMTVSGSSAEGMLYQVIAGFDGVLARLARCAETETTCTAYRACRALGTVRPTGTSPCAGDVHWDSAVGPIDCRGLSDGLAACSSSGCGTTAACTGGTPPTCRGEVLVNCADTTFPARHCPSVFAGSTCVASGGIAECAPSTPACTGGGSRCVGNTAVFCRQEPLGYVRGMMLSWRPREISVDCGSFGASCVSGACRMPAPACSFGDAPMFSPTDATWCIGEQWVTVPLPPR